MADPIKLMSAELAKDVAAEATAAEVLTAAAAKEPRQLVVIGLDAERKPFCVSTFKSVRRMRGLYRILEKAIRDHEAAEIKAAEEAKAAAAAPKA